MTQSAQSSRNKMEALAWSFALSFRFRGRRDQSSSKNAALLPFESIFNYVLRS